MQTGSSTLYDEKTSTKTRYYPRWQIIGLNDDVTPMDYVVYLLIDIFHKNQDDAFQLMMEVHNTGAAVFYRGTREACELKVEQVQGMNKKFEEHLQVRMEPMEE